MSSLTGLSAEYQAGIRQHRQIDAFTDAHPVVRQSIQRLGPEFRRFGGILMDVFYDHFLSRDWARFSNLPLPAFTAQVYASFDAHWTEIPEEAHPPLRGMRQYDWLCSYGDMDSLAITFKRISRRFRRPVDLSLALPAFEKAYTDIERDFAEFFPQLQAHVSKVDA